MKAIIDVIVNKLAGIVNGNACFSATLYDTTLDKNSAIRQKVRIYHSTVGKYSYIGRNSLVQNATIGAYCSVSEDCNIGMPSHPSSFVSTSPVFLQGPNCLKTNIEHFSYQDCPRTIIGNDVLIGAHAQIKSGVVVGDGAIIGAGAVVTRDVPPYAIVGGIPAKVIKYRFSETVCDEIKKLAWWDMPVERLKMIANCFDSPEKLVAVIHSKGWDK